MSRIILIGLWAFAIGIVNAQTLEEGFESSEVLSEMLDPASFDFAPDGRLFYGERISGQLRVAEWNASLKKYVTLAEPFYTFDVPTERHRSSGLRGFAFDPDFANNGYIYAFYMKNNPRHNRVVRIQADPNNSNIASTEETLLLDLPFGSSSSSGSHNGGDLVFGNDGYLYISTGDGWNGGDNVQSLSTYTGKIFRISTQGDIPSDNPFYNTASGDYRAIYALGLRNPYAISNVSPSGSIYVNDAVGSNKATVYQLESGANYAHDGYNGIGTNTAQWNNMSVNNAKVISGGVWYPNNGYWPSDYSGNYFAAFWGSNSSNAPGMITRAVSEQNTSKSAFYSDMLISGGLKPVMLKLGADGNLYYLMTSYETGQGAVYKIAYTNTPRADVPSFDPSAGQFDDPIQLSMTSGTSNVEIYYTLDNSLPDSNSTLYSNPVTISTTSTVQAIAYADGFAPSGIKSCTYQIGPVPNLSPIADAGPDLIEDMNGPITLNGADSYDPDGSPLEIQEQWEQISGPSITINDADETVANFSTNQAGFYQFRITVEDIYGATDSDDVWIHVAAQVPDYLDNLIARWPFSSGSGNIIEDHSANSFTGFLENSEWRTSTVDSSKYSMLFDNSQDRIELGGMDISASSMSICFWTKLTDHSVSDARFISKASGENDEDHYWMLSTLNDSRFRFRLKTADGVTSTLSSALNVLNTGEWMFLTATYDGSFMRLYKNGVILDSLAKSGNLATDPFTDVCIGNQPSSATGGARHLTGYIDEMRIYSSALSVEQMLIIMNFQLTDICPDALFVPAIGGENQFAAHMEINTTANLNADLIQFFAGSHIDMLDPFEVQDGTTFETYMISCRLY